MARKSNKEQLDEIRLKMEQLKNREKQILARERESERKARNHRLIEIGAEVEAALGYTLDSKASRKGLGDFIRTQEFRGKWATKAIDDAIKKEEERIAKEKELETASEASNETNSNLSNNIIDDKPW